MTEQNATERLREEILAEAKKKGEEIIMRAKQDAEAHIKNAVSEAERLRQMILEQAHKEAERQSELILATVPVETGRLRAARIESLLESIRDEASKRLRNHDGFPYYETLITLASHAINNMVGNAFVVKVYGSEKNDMAEKSLSEEIARRVGRQVQINISYQQGSSGDGVIIEDAEGRQVWDNRLLEKLNRLWPELRRQIALEAGFVPKKTKGGENP